jgi:hypothetical protein
VEATATFRLCVSKNQLNAIVDSNSLAGNHWVDLGNLQTSNEYLEIINRPIKEIHRYGRTNAWLFDLADSIFGEDTDLNTKGLLWAKTRTSEGFISRGDMAADLKAGTYEFRLVTGQPRDRGFSMSRYWASAQPVLKTPGEKRRPYFPESVRTRDGRCVISKLTCNLVGSHLIPNRFPHDAILMLLQRHTRPYRDFPTNTQWGESVQGVNPNANNDARIGVLAFGGLDSMIDDFTLGFYCPDPVDKPNVYTVHHFDNAAEEYEYNVLGVTHKDFKDVTGSNTLKLNALHGQQVTFEDRNGFPRPLDAAIRWHYMQCVLRNLGTGAFRGLPVW